MKVSEYRQMMAYLTRPKFNNGGSVGSFVKPKKKPKEEAEKVNKARKEKNFEKAKPALENPKEVKEMMNLADGGRIGFKQGNPFPITDEVLKEIDNLIKNTDLDLKSIGKQIKYGTDKTQLKIDAPVMKAYIEKYGKPKPGRLKPANLAKDPEYVKFVIDKVKEKKGNKTAVSKELGIERKTINNILKQNAPELMKPENIPGPETGAKAIKKRAQEAIKEGETKAGPKTTKQARQVKADIADRNKIYADIPAEELAKDKNFLKRLRLTIDGKTGAVDFTGYTEANPVRGKVFTDIELAQHAIDKAKNGELFTHDHITPKRFRTQNIQYPINFQPVTYMENSQFENARTYLTNNPSGNVAPINTYLKSNNKTIRFKIDNNRYKYGYKGNIEFNPKTGNQTLLDFEKRINVGGRGPVASTFGAGQKIPSFGKAGQLVKGVAKAEGVFAPAIIAGGSMYGLPFKRSLYEATYGLAGDSKSDVLKRFQPQASTFLDFNDAQQKYNTLLNNYNNASQADKFRFKDKMAEKTKEFENLQRQYLNLPLPERVRSEAAAGKAETQYTDLLKANRDRRFKYGVIPKPELFIDIKDYFGGIGKNIRENIRPTENVLGTTIPMGNITGQTQYDFAGGGIAKLAGKSSGPPPESGPTPQGLDFLLNRGR